MTGNTGKIRGEVSLPGSKSISNRLLVMQAFSQSKVQFNNLSDSDDTRLLKFYLERIASCATSSLPLVIDAANAGAPLRFLAAYLSVKKGLWLLTGNERMRKRPVEGLVLALQELGADVEYAGEKGFPPLRITGKRLAGDSVAVDASVSSQFVSALMLIAPYLKKGLHLRLTKKPVSFAYIEMTAKLMAQHGIVTEASQERVEVLPGVYKMETVTVEPDWSAASYWYLLASLSGSTEIFLPGLLSDSIQGDRVVAKVFDQLGVSTRYENGGIRLSNRQDFQTAFSYDFSSCPDLVPAVMACCAGKGIRASLTGIAHLRHKESDRIASMKTELEKTGVVVKATAQTVELIPSGKELEKTGCVFDTHGDHRLAMALSPLMLKLKEVQINDPEVVSKSYPRFWKDLERLGIGTTTVS